MVAWIKGPSLVTSEDRLDYMEGRSPSDTKQALLIVLENESTTSIDGKGET